MSKSNSSRISLCLFSIILIAILVLLSAGFEPTILSLKITNGFEFPIKVYYGQIYRGETKFFTDTKVEVTHTYETATSASTLGLYIIPIQLNPGQSGNLKFTVAGPLFSCSRNEKQDLVITAENELGEIVYRQFFSMSEIKAKDFELLVASS
jgi:hypothetical protein